MAPDHPPETQSKITPAPWDRGGGGIHPGKISKTKQKTKGRKEVNRELKPEREPGREPGKWGKFRKKLLWLRDPKEDGGLQTEELGGGQKVLWG